MYGSVRRSVRALFRRRSHHGWRLVVLASVALAVVALLGVRSAPVRAASSNCSKGTTLSTVAHEDDSLIFQSPDLLHDIQGGRCVITVFVTAGDDGQGAGYWQGRESGAQAAYAQMAGVANNWTTADAGIAGHPAPMRTLTAAPNISLIFLRLPDGFPSGTGSAMYGNQSLQKLWQGTISQIDAVDGSSSYTKQGLINVLTGLMSRFQPDTIRTQDYVGAYGDGDHSDHHTVAYMTYQAQQQYSTAHTIIGYMDYLTSALAQNVFGTDLTTKQNAYNTYATYDSQAWPSNWIPRQYETASENVGGGGTQAVISFSSSTYSVSESSGSAQIAIERTGSTSGTASVHFATADGSGTAGANYTSVSQTVTFSSGQTQQTVAVPVIDDGLLDGDPTVSLSLSSPSSGAILASPSAATLTIANADSAFAFSSSTYSASESSGSAHIAIERTGSTLGTASVHFATADGSGTAGANYTSVSQTVTFSPGQTEQTVAVPVIDDRLPDGDKTVSLSLSSPSSGAILTSPSAATLTIANADSAFAFSSSTYSASESSGSAQIAIERTGSTLGTASVHFATADGSGTAGANYTSVSQTVTFSPGQTEQTVAVPVIDDRLPDGDKTVSLSLSSPSSGAILTTPSAATLTIANADSAFAFSSSTYSASESSGSAQIAIERTGSTLGTDSVHFATADGTASSPGDYSSVAKTIDFSPGETQQTVTVPIVDESEAESDETVLLSLSSPSSRSFLGSPSAATLTIRNDDAASSPTAIAVTGAGQGDDDLQVATAAISAHLTKSHFKRRQAGKVEVVYRFSSISKTFATVLRYRKSGAWRRVRAVSEHGSFTGAHTITIKRLFAHKSIRKGHYSLRLTSDRNSILLSFMIE